MVASLSLIELASMGKKMKATAVRVFMSLESILPGQAHRTRNCEHYWKGYMDSLSESLSAGSQVRGHSTIKDSNKRKCSFPQIKNPYPNPTTYYPF